MKLFSFLLFIPLAVNHFAHAEADRTGDQDVLFTVSQKLTQINNRLKDNRVFISTATLDWPQWDNFRSQLMFTAAHDPHGKQNKDLPLELNPTYQTQYLKQVWNALEVSVLGIGELAKDAEWMALKVEMGEFFKLRDKFLYQPARAMIKSGLLMDRLNKIRESASPILRETASVNNVSVKVVDPFMEKMAHELAALDSSIHKLKEMRNPPKVETPTIFHQRFLEELITLGGGAFISGLFLSFVFFWLKKKMTKKTVEMKSIKVPDAFNYYEWLRDFEKNLQSLKNNEDNMNEECINLKVFASDLSEGRKSLNSADNQQDYYTGLERLNASAIKIEEHFEKLNLRKNTEASRRLISQIVQLCDAVENRKEMSFEDPKPKLRVFKQGQVSLMKSA